MKNANKGVRRGKMNEMENRGRNIMGQKNMGNEEKDKRLKAMKKNYWEGDVR